MTVQQLSVFIDNTSGKIAEFTNVLAQENINLASLSIADGTNFGIVRFIVENPDIVISKLMQKGYTVKATNVLAVYVPDKPGGLAGILSILAKENIVVHYLYSFVRNQGENALIIIRVNETEKAVELLKKEGIRLLLQKDLKAN